MLLHILKKDLKRKRTMNIILLLFITMAATFLAGSVNNLLTITGAVDSFLEMANVPDLMLVTLGEEGMRDFLESSPSVREFEAIELIAVLDDNIRIIQCAGEEGGEKYERGNTVAVQPLPGEYMKIFDLDGNEVMLNEGEIALPKAQAEKNNLQPGDILRLTFGSRTKEFTVRTLVKDAVFGSEMMGFKRLFITDEDYAYMTEGGEYSPFMLYCVDYADEEAFQQEYKKQGFHVVSSVEKTMGRMCYVFDMLTAGILLIVSICLILISFLILRFTIVFTLQEDYKEIGIMKAIGIKDQRIKVIYLIKYLAIAMVGCVIGFFASFPFGNFLLSQVMTNMVETKNGAGVLVNAVCAFLIVAVVLLFCYSCTRRVKRITVMEAIRSGGNGERYHAKNLIRLHGRKRMRPCTYMAVNDLVSNSKRYLVLMIIFCIGTLEILLPLSAIHTLKSKDILRAFNMQQATVFVDNGRMEHYFVEGNDDGLFSDMEEMERILSENGLDADVWAEVFYGIPWYAEDPGEKCFDSTFQEKGREEEDYDVLSGRLPELPNEVMITELTAEELGVGIGDFLYYGDGEQAEEFIITGTFQTMLNMGKGFRVSRYAGIKQEHASGMLAFQIQIDSSLTEEELTRRIQEIFPDYKIYGEMEYMGTMIGGILEQLDVLKVILTAMVLLINVLITVLMMKTLIVRERGEIAMLKSIGFANRTIKAWQSLRILFVLAFAMLLGTALSRILLPVTISPIFAMMGGTGIRLKVEPLEAYVFFPLLFFLVTGIAAYLCAGEADRVKVKEINTLE